MTTKALLLCFFSSCFLFNPIKTSEIQIISSIKSNWQDSTIDCLLVLNGFYEKSDINHEWWQKQKRLIVSTFFIIKWPFLSV